MAKRTTKSKASDAMIDPIQAEPVNIPALPKTVNMALIYDAAFGAGTRKRGWIAGKCKGTESGFDWDTFEPDKSLSEAEIRNVKANPQLFEPVKI